MDSLLPRLVLCSQQSKLNGSIILKDRSNLTRTPQRSSFPRFQVWHQHALFISPSFQQHQLPRCFSSFSSLTCITAKAKSQTDTHHFLRHAEELAISLVCSLLFLGGFSFRPALASVNVPTTSSSPLEEKREETQIGIDEDEDLYLRILEKNPRDVEALKVVLYGKMRKGKTKEAVEYVERLIDIEPDEVEWRLLQALSFELMGQLSKAKRLFKEVLEERPLLLRALHGLALVMHKNHEGAAVFEMLNKALELSRRKKRVTEERNIKILIAQMHVVKGDFEEGLKRYQDLVNEDPRDFRPYLCQGIIYSLLDKKKEAEEQFENYRSFVPQEFPQRGFLDDVILTAKTESREQLQEEFDGEFSYKK
ncbi:protein SLOW GREEN 1, chloroplastic [Aristolochia californica]|uniref:protein SLOW GREEN 1, chloroplastic n=1 Tax=Aristolochia californica TaxID=171875 RepID=UPI0035D5CEDA